MTTYKTVAATILEQLGGNRFIVMTGASNLIGSDNSLTFKLPSMAHPVTHVQIELGINDLYKMEFLSCGRRAQNGVPTYFRDVVAVREDLYFDQIQAAFTQVTGLATHL